MIIAVHAVNIYDKVGRRSIDRAAHALQPPTNRARKKPAMPIYARESIFWGKNIRFGAKHPNYFGREFWYPHLRKPPSYLNCIVFLVGHGIKWARKAYVWPKMPIFGQESIWRATTLNFIPKSGWFKIFGLRQKWREKRQFFWTNGKNLTKKSKNRFFF